MSLSFLELVIELRFSFLSGRMEYTEVYIKSGWFLVKNHKSVHRLVLCHSLHAADIS